VQRCDHVIARDRRAVMKGQPVAQRELVGQAVGGHAPIADHLRLHLKIFVQGEERVVRHVAVVTGDVRCGPPGIEDL
jgi:hypothetical protein